ncbi:hypothetical protein [Methylocystis heyeri]|uniref:Uncharacterized protein n=1 Tax=Methylocystis heyeri TaxID=391905 RepID=A0A6B8KFQ6_9HYPH|nr:hypothetical protein [Methylocystis heyeri]QGM45323.1 hypothetical protein H2LOC_006215 [Methylocystis heyeri]
MSDKADKGSPASEGEALEPEAGRVPKKDTTALSNALRANLQRRKQAQRAREQESGPETKAEDEAKWTK